jgi:hypothetical protein
MLLTLFSYVSYSVWKPQQRPGQQQRQRWSQSTMAGSCKIDVTVLFLHNAPYVLCHLHLHQRVSIITKHNMHMFVICFGCKCIYCDKVRVQSDDKPLVPISKKNDMLWNTNAPIPGKLQRWQSLLEPKIKVKMSKFKVRIEYKIVKLTMCKT